MGTSLGCLVVDVARERAFPTPQVDSVLAPTLHPTGEYLRVSTDFTEQAFLFHVVHVKCYFIICVNVLI